MSGTIPLRCYLEDYSPNTRRAKSIMLIHICSRGYCDRANSKRGITAAQETSPTAFSSFRPPVVSESSSNR